MTPAELAVGVLGAGNAAPLETGGSTMRRLEIWSKNPDEFVALVSEYDPVNGVEMGQINYGPVVAITPVESGDRP